MAEATPNPNDYKVVAFHNREEFGFTPDMGCMYDGRPINGKNGSPGIDPGETVILPYHVAQQLAINLAKRVLNTSPAATVDPAGIPTGVPIWSKDALEVKKNEYLTDLYAEEKPLPQSQTDILMAKVEEYKGMVDQLLAQNQDKIIAKEHDFVASKPDAPVEESAPQGYADKQEVLAELEKRGIKHDKGASKANLEKLLI